MENNIAWHGKIYNQWGFNVLFLLCWTFWPHFLKWSGPEETACPLRICGNILTQTVPQMLLLENGGSPGIAGERTRSLLWEGEIGKNHHTHLKHVHKTWLSYLGGIVSFVPMLSHKILTVISNLCLLFLIHRLQRSFRKIWPGSAKSSQSGPSFSEWHWRANPFVPKRPHFCPPAHIHWCSLWWVAEETQLWWAGFCLCYFTTILARGVITHYDVCAWFPSKYAWEKLARHPSLPAPRNIMIPSI